MSTKLNTPTKHLVRVKRKLPKTTKEPLEDSIPKPEELDFRKLYDEQPDIM
jgi:hypothetical protein